MKDIGQAIHKAAQAHEHGDWGKARAICRRILAAKPDHFDALTLLGIMSAQSGRVVEAVAFFTRAVDANTCEPSAHSNLGNALKALNRFDAALSSYDQAIKHGPGYAEAYYNRGLALQELGRWTDALESYNRAISLSPNYAAYCNRGIVLRELKRLDEALDSYDRAIALQPDLAEAYNNRGIVLKDQNKLDAALQNYDFAIKLKPDYAEPHCNRGHVLRELRLLDAAVASYQRAIQLEPDHADAHFNLSLCYLGLGEFTQGWDEHEWRWQSEEICKKRAVINTRYAPDWDGTALQGALLALPEQGIGDTIFYSGTLNDLRSHAKSITVCVDPRLLKLYQRSFVDMTFVATNDLNTSLHFDAQVYTGSLGRFFRRTQGAFENIKVPYLYACNDHIGRLRTQIKTEGKLVCGLSWISKNTDFGADKSLGLKDLEPLLSMPNVDFVDLQYGDTSAEQTALYASTGLALKRITEIDNFTNIDGLAALIGACDVVVTISNTTAHLAAALGKPTLVILPFSSGLLWYWHAGRNDSPWYPSVRLFRQNQAGDWASVVQQVRQALLQQPDHLQSLHR